MPVYKEEPNSIAAPPVVEQTNTLETASVYHNREFSTPLITFLTGDNWTVNYYSQHIGADDVMASDDDISDATLKQYEKIDDFVLKVTSPLSPEFDETSGLTVVRGEANVMPFITPIVDDIFIAEMGDDYYGKFSITRAVRQTMYKESAWVIEYTLLEYVDRATLDLLNTKVINELVYSPTLLHSENGPIVTKGEYDRNTTRVMTIYELVDSFYCDFFDYKTNTFVSPNELEHYDHYMTAFWNTVIGADYRLDNPRPEMYPLADSLLKNESRTFWDAFGSRSTSMLKRVEQKMDCVHVSDYRSYGVNFKLTASTLDYILIPGDTDFYLFSEAFYTGDYDNMSSLETLVMTCIKGDSVNFDLVQTEIALLEDAESEIKFNHTLVLIVLLKIAGE